MYIGKKVSVVIPTYNEADSLENIINGFYATGFVDEVLVVNNNALGDTKTVVERTKAKQVFEKEKQGYGFALMRGLNEATGDLIVMVEGDGTFEPKDIHKFLLYSEDFQAVFGTRTSRASIWSGAFMPFPVRFGNWLWAKFLEVIHNGSTFTDVGCTYKMISREVLEQIKPLFKFSRGDGKFSPELMIWILKKGIKPIEIPVLFKPRVGQSMYTGSVTKAAVLGFKMIWLIIKYRFIKF